MATGNLNYINSSYKDMFSKIFGIKNREKYSAHPVSDLAEVLKLKKICTRIFLICKLLVRDQQMHDFWKKVIFCVTHIVN